MSKMLVAVLAILMAMFAVPTIASAHHNPNHEAGTPCENGNPTDLCGPDISIDDPTEEECPNGGIVFVLNDTRFPVCNGADGQDGSNGSDGENGSDGTNGTNGVDGQNGADGAAGANGQNGANGAAGSDGADALLPNSCTSTRTAKFHISKNRGDRIRGLRATFHGKRLKVVKKSSRRWVVRVPLTGLPQGVWAVHVRARVNGKIHRHAHLFRTCYSTDTHREGLNSRPVVRL